jgi:hypothetical protein
MGFLSMLVKCGFDGAAVEQGMKKIEGQAEHLGSHLKSTLAGAFTLGALEEFARGGLERGHQLETMAEQLGVTAEEMQRVELAAVKSGLEVTDLMTALDRLSKAQAAVNEGNVEMVNHFRVLGLTVSDLKSRLTSIALGKDIGLMLGVINEKDPEVRAALMGVLGRRGARIAGALKRLTDSGEPIGGMLSEEAISSAGAAKVAQEVGWIGFKNMMTRVVGYLYNRAIEPLDMTGGLFGGTHTGGASGEWSNEEMAKQIIAEHLGVDKSEFNSTVGESVPNPGKYWQWPIRKAGGTSTGDSLSEIGGFVGGAGIDPTKNLLRQSLDVQKQSKEYLRTIANSQGQFG